MEYESLPVSGYFQFLHDDDKECYFFYFGFEFTHFALSIHLKLMLARVHGLHSYEYCLRHGLKWLMGGDDRLIRLVVVVQNIVIHLNL